MMNSRRLFVVVSGVAVIVALFYFAGRIKFPTQNSGPREPEEPPVTMPDQKGASTDNSETSQDEVERSLARTFTEEEIKLKPPDVSWRAWAYAVDVHRMAVEENGDVMFFGKVVSEDGEPLGGVNLTAEISASKASLMDALASGEKSHARKIEITTDQNGKFKITGFGKTLTVANFEKPGYSLLSEKKYKGIAPKKAWSYSFIANSPSSFQPDEENPEVFTMRKVE